MIVRLLLLIWNRKLQYDKGQLLTDCKNFMKRKFCRALKKLTFSLKKIPRSLNKVLHYILGFWKFRVWGQVPSHGCFYYQGRALIKFNQLHYVHLIRTEARRYVAPATVFQLSSLSRPDSFSCQDRNHTTLYSTPFFFKALTWKYGRLFRS